MYQHPADGHRFPSAIISNMTDMTEERTNQIEILYRFSLHPQSNTCFDENLVQYPTKAAAADCIDFV